MKLTQEQIENIQIDYGIVFVNYGVTGERQLAPTRGGGTFTATKNIREIEYDGRRGKTKGMQVVDEIGAMLSVSLLDTSMDNLALSIPWATYENEKISATSEDLGVIRDSAYLNNITLFAKVIGGGYKKITLYSAMSENDFSLAATPKNEGVITLEVHAHWDAENDAQDLYDIEDIQGLNGDVVAPTVATVPGQGDTGVAVDVELVAVFDEQVRQQDINLDNFTLMKIAGDIVAGSIHYDYGTKTAIFTPDGDLDTSTGYAWIITNVRDIAGNKMMKKVITFTTES